jgi:hypothetical protein
MLNLKRGEVQSFIEEWQLINIGTMKDSFNFAVSIIFINSGKNWQ